MDNSLKLQIGDELLDYISAIQKIETDIGYIIELSNKCMMFLVGNPQYEGRALCEMQAYVNSFDGNLQKMQYFYGVARTYVTTVYQETYLNEEQLIYHYVNEMQ